jgi:hypothetical protein
VPTAPPAAGSRESRLWLPLLILGGGITGLAVTVLGIVLSIRSSINPAGERKAGGSPPGQVTDVRQLRPPTRTRFSATDIDETAEWAIVRIAGLKKFQGNDFRFAQEKKLVNEELRGYVGQKVEWKLPVDRIFVDSVRFHCTWFTTDGSRHPNNRELFGDLAGKLLMTETFEVRFRSKVRDVVDDDATDDQGLRPFKKGKIVKQGLPGDEDGRFLMIGEQISRNLALRLKPNDLGKISGKIESLRIDVYGVCVLAVVAAKE